MRKQTKKVLSWVLAGAMALSLIPSVGLVSEKADAAVSTVDKVVFDKAVESKLVGGDSGEARLLVFNNWGKYDPNALEGISMKDASITFNVEGVADVLAKTGAKSIKAFLGLNSSDWSVNTLGNTAPADGVTEIEKDGTYTVTYTGSSTITLGNQMGVMFADIDSALEKDDDKNVTAGLKVSDTKLQLKAPALMKDVTSFDKAVESKLVGGDSGEARLLVFNNWGKYDPSELEGIDVKNASITFKVAGVADVLAKTGAKSIKAFLGLNSSDWSVNTLGNTVPANGVTEIEKDGTYTVTANSTSKNYTGSKTVNAEGKAADEKPDAPMISSVKVVGNKATAILSGDSEGAAGYDYVISTDRDCITNKDYDSVNKNQVQTSTTFKYVQQGTYYAYCHAWKRDENGKKVFSDWSNAYPFVVSAITPDAPVITNVKVSGSTIKVTYKAAANATGYDVVLGTDSKKENGETRPYHYGNYKKLNLKEGTVTATFKNVPKGTWVVGMHAFNRTSEDGKKVFSPWSNLKKATVK